jgi:hypothetical protein
MLKAALGGWIPVVGSLALIVLWGANFTPSVDNLRAALVFATTASVFLTGTSLYCIILIWSYQRKRDRVLSEKTSGVHKACLGWWSR